MKDLQAKEKKEKNRHSASFSVKSKFLAATS